MLNSEVAYWFLGAAVIGAVLSAVAWKHCTRGESKAIRKWSGIAVLALFILYHPLSWVPAGAALGLGWGVYTEYNVPIQGFYLFAIVSALVTGGLAWALSYAVLRLTKTAAGSPRVRSN